MIIDRVWNNRDIFWLQKFSVGMWAITFPIGYVIHILASLVMTDSCSVFATATTELATELDSTEFKVIGTFLSVQVAMHWVYVSILKIYKCFDGTIFVAPELAGFPGKRPKVRGQRNVEKA